MSELQELWDTVAKLQAEKYPELPLPLLRRIVQIEVDYPDDRQEAGRQIAVAVAEFLNTEG